MQRPLVCATVTASSTAELRRRRDEVRLADMVELRLDTVADIDVGGALAGRRLPAIVTCRPAWEGGSFRGSETERRRILADALEAGADFVDVEWAAGFDDLVAKRRGRGIVLSMHDFGAGLPDLESRVAAMRATGAEVIKVAVTARRLTDCLKLPRPDATGGSKTVAIAMGPSGVASRILAARFGSAWVYAGDAAPGQVGVDELVGRYRFRSISAATAIYGLVGCPIGHSLSPAIHNAAFASIDLDAVYVPMTTDSADDFIAFAGAIGLSGASVTTPLKVEMASRVASLDPVAARAGAVNTISRPQEGWFGSNTDVAGFLEPLGRAGALAGLRAAILGAGGAARAAAVGLADAGARVTIHARRPDRARELARQVGACLGDAVPPAGSWDLLVNATPVGTTPDADSTPLAAERLDGRVVYDLVYNPPQTRLLREARAAGCRTIGGLEMLLAQAARQIAAWTGQSPDLDLMRRAAMDRLAELASATSRQGASSSPRSAL